MIWKLFRPKPILKIIFPSYVDKDTEQHFINKFKKDYIVIVEHNLYVSELKIEIIK